MLESSDKMWSTGEGNGKSLQYSCLENPMKGMTMAAVTIPGDFKLKKKIKSDTVSVFPHLFAMK